MQRKGGEIMADDREKINGEDVKIKISNPFLTKLENFWFHHKWKVIISAFFLVVIGVGAFQMFTKEKYDTQVSVATHVIYNKEDLEAFNKTLESFMPSDVNSDGKKNLAVYRYRIYSEDEIADANKGFDENGHPIIVAEETYIKEQISELNNTISSGQCTLMFVSAYEYQVLVDKRPSDVLLLPMSELFGEDLPEGVTENGYGVKLRDISAYGLEGFNWLPEDTVICILRKFPTVSEERYEADKEMFKNIVEFGE